MSAGKGPSKKFDHIRNALGTRGRIAAGMAKPYKESCVTCNAIADCAKAREVNKKTLLENGRQWIVEIGSFCESPKFFSDLGSLRREAEEIWKYPKSPFDTLP